MSTSPAHSVFRFTLKPSLWGWSYLDPLYQLPALKQKLGRSEYGFQEHNLLWKFSILPGDCRRQSLPVRCQDGRNLAGRSLPLFQMYIALISGCHPHLKVWATCAQSPPFLTQPLYHCPSSQASSICLCSPYAAAVLCPPGFPMVGTIWITCEC